MSAFEQTLLRGLHWFSSAETQEEPENRLLNLITCIETCLTPRDGNPITTAIAEGAAIIIAHDLAGRRHLKKRIQELYRRRSAISHGGQTALLDSEWTELRHIAGALLVTLIKRKEEFASQRDLLEWIETKKLGGE